MTPNHQLRVFYDCSRAIVAIAALMQPFAVAGQPAPSPEATGAAAPPTETEPGAEMLVVADPSQRTSIDRTTYLIRDTAEARTSNILDLLERIPSVDVTNSGQLRLLGRAGVRILFDGNEVSNPQLVLRNLQGSQVARIEVVTNPSAQFSAQGTAGVINIVLRRSAPVGVGGSATATVGDFGGYDFKVSPTWSRGPLALSGSLGVARSVQRSEFTTDRSSVAAGGVIDRHIEEGNRHDRSATITGNLSAVYQLSPKQSITVSAALLEANGESSGRSALSSLLAFYSSQVFTGTSYVNSRSVSAVYNRDGPRSGEALSFTTDYSSSRGRGGSIFSGLSEQSLPRQWRLASDGTTSMMGARLNYVRPFGPARNLSLGAVIRDTRNDNIFEESGQLPFGQGGGSSSSVIGGSILEKAVYATYQFPLLGGTALAGLRVEDRRYNFDQGQNRGPGGTYAFPSLHLERKLADNLTVQLSYSRRINWPTTLELDPSLRFSDTTTASAGNPSLLPEITDSFEAKLIAQVLGQNVELTAFSQRTGDLRSSLAELNENDVLVIRSVNLGVRMSRGLNLSLQGQLGEGFSYILSGNLADQHIERDSGDSDFVETSTDYGGSAQLEYRDGPERRRHTDRLEVRARYSGPLDLGLVRFAPIFTVNASWSHAFTDRLSGILNITDVIGPPTTRILYIADSSLSQQTNRATGPRITFSLTYSLGSPPRR